MNINELRVERGIVVVQMRELSDKAAAEKRKFTAEEETQWTAMNTDCDRLKTDIERAERQHALELETRQPDAPPTRMPDPQPQKATAETPPEGRASEAYLAAFRDYLVNGKRNMDPIHLRALQSDSNTLGGYVATPQVFIASLIQALDAELPIRALATKYQIASAVSIGAPSLDTDFSDVTWTNEIATGGEDTSMAFGKRELFPHPVARKLKVSNKLLRVTAIPVDQLIRERMTNSVGKVHENAFLNGTGANQPLGLFVASDNGVPSSRDVTSGNTSTAIGADNLFEMVYTLKPGYLGRASTRWVFHRVALKNIRKLKDGNGQYLWQPGLIAGQPDMILGVQVVASEYAPSAFTTGTYVGLLGDLSRYWIVDAMDASIRVLNELYAETDQVGYIIRAETDGMPVQAEAFVRSKLT